MTERYIETGCADSETKKSLDFAALVKEAVNGGKAKRKYFIQTFGCQQNEADSERLAGMCAMMGYERAERPEDAGLILVNTCAVREHAEKKALSIIGQYKHIKDADPSVMIGVGGCMVTQESRSNKLKMSYPYVSFTFDTGALYKVPELLYSALTQKKRIFYHSDEWGVNEGVPIMRESGHMAWLSIMYGCNNFCSYCIVPYVRGRERSRRADEIVEEAKRLIADGARDITLLGQNVNSYKGEDGCDISDLMRRICALEGDFRVRFMTSHPKDASEKLMRVMAEEEKVVKHFHLPVQSGSNDVLRRMNRKYTRESYLEKLAKLREYVPDVSITSDIIVGFPGESDADFEDTLDVMRQARYDMVYSFIFSPRTGTPAAEMEGQIPHEVSTERMSRLLALEDEISKERNARFIGREVRVLTDGGSKVDSDMLTCRGDMVRPVHVKRKEGVAESGEFIKVKITREETYCFFGEILNQ